MVPLPAVFRRMENLSFEYPSTSRTKSTNKADRRTTWMKRIQTQWITIEKLARDMSEAISQTSLRQVWLETRKFLTVDNIKRKSLNFIKLFDRNVLLRGIFGYIFSFLIILGVLSLQNEIPYDVSLPICGILSIIFMYFYMISDNFRCVMILSIPQFSTQQGRFVLFAIITGLWIGGPFTSFGKNMEGIGESVKCISTSTLKHGQDMMENFNQSYYEMSNFLGFHIENLKNVKMYVDGELESTHQFFRNFEDKLDQLQILLVESGENCHRDIEAARFDCVARTLRAFDNCKKNNFLKYLKINDICEIVFITTDLCEKLRLVDPDVICFPVTRGINLTKIMKNEILKFQKYFEFELNVKHELNQELKNDINTTQIEEKIRTSFDKIIQNTLMIMKIIKYFFLSSIVWIPIKSWIFLQKIRKGQSSKFNFLKQLPQLSERDQQRQHEFCSQGFLLLIHFLSTMTIFLVDYACYWLLNYLLEISDEFGQLSFNNSYELTMNTSIGSALLLNPIVDFQNDYLNKLSNVVQMNYTFNSSPKNCFSKPVESTNLLLLLIILSVYILIILMLTWGNSILKYRIQIIQFILPELKPKSSNPTLIPSTAFLGRSKDTPTPTTTKTVSTMMEESEVCTTNLTV